MKYIIKICRLAISLYVIVLYGQENIDANQLPETQKESSTSSHSDNKKNKAKSTIKEEQTKTTIKKTDGAIQSTLNPIPLKTTLFVNGRVNQILLVITDEKNKQSKITIKAGMHYSLSHKPQSIKKVVCYELQAPNTNLSQTDLNNYTVFVFNADQKLEKYHFISVLQKTHAIKRARKAKDEKLALEIEEQNIYRL